ncbi:hypothetical protein KEM54_005698 [Ascosphaera aggregata]|nr:hypothetical protein KEM54_005698 [Ascosphaera aggregata]
MSNSDPASTGLIYKERDGKVLRGFIFIETDRISGLEPNHWDYVLDEFSFISRVSRGKPLPDEGHNAVDKFLCLGIVPWAPMPAGPDVLSIYMDKLHERCSCDLEDDPWRKVCGVRSLEWLGDHGFAFDLGIDQRQGGLWQLEEAILMLQKLYGGAPRQRRVNIIITNAREMGGVLEHPDYKDWKRCITQMAKFPHAYIKLSGGFSELPPQPSNFESKDTENDLVMELADSIQPWTSHIFKAFTPSRVMFGSDWPVCNINGGGKEVSWARWTAIVEKTLDNCGLSTDEQKAVWSRTASEAYNLSTAAC